MPFKEVLQRQSQWLVLTEALALAILIGWVDWLSGWEWSLFVFYALPIVMVVLRSGERVGFVFAAVSAAIWWLAQIDSNPYHTRWGFALAVANRLFYFVVLVIAVAAIEARREADRARIASLERARELEQEILRASEREQQRIGRDLHDSLGPHLAAIGYAVTFLTSDMEKRNLPEAEKLQKIGALVSEAVSLTRNLARGIFPVQMDSSGLAAALEDLAATTSQLSGIAITFCEDGDVTVEDPEAAMHLYRIAQEAITNARKHGQATSVSISLGKSDGITRLIIADNGKGMSSTGSGVRGGIGLHSMRYRVRFLHGEIKIESEAGEGTRVVCDIPEQISTPAPVTL